MANEPFEEAVGAAELVEVLGQRSATYALLSRLYLREVDQELLDELHGMLYPVETGDAAMDEVTCFWPPTSPTCGRVR